MGSPVLTTLALRYRQTRAGRTGQSARDFRIDYEELLREAQSVDGDARLIAERELAEAERDGVLVLERHRRTGLKLKVIFKPANETALFDRLQELPPSQERAQLAADFQEAATDDVPAEYTNGWIRFCARMADAAESGGSLFPWLRSDNARYLLSLLPQILRWEGDTPIRFASAHLCGDSKRLEQLQSKLEDALSEITEGKITSLADVGILSNERSILLCGPLELIYPEGTLNLALLHAPARIDDRDIKRAQLNTSTTLCVTVENGAMLHQLSKARGSVLYASSGSEGGFAHPAIIHFLNELPRSVALIHFGDSDPTGFEILTGLRRRVNRQIDSAGMDFRDDPNSAKLDARDKKSIDALLRSNWLIDSEKESLTRMIAAGRKGRFEQEAMTATELPSFG